MVKCLENGIEKEIAIPKIINEFLKELPIKNNYLSESIKPKRKMRSAEEIMKDYGLEAVNYG